MHYHRLFAAVLTVMLTAQLFAEAPDIDKELSDLAERLATPIQNQGKKKVTVVDFTDLHGGASDLGKYIAEQLTVNLVMGNRKFAVLDRANLNTILAELKLNSKGLTDPENAKKLGKFAGVDALILGNIIPKDQTVMLTAKIITTETTEIAGAARGEFKSDDRIQKLLLQPATNSYPGEVSGPPPVIKTYDDLQITFQPLKIVNDEKAYQLTMTITNKNPRRTLYLALAADSLIDRWMRGRLMDSSDNDFRPFIGSVEGAKVGVYSEYGYTGYAKSVAPFTEIHANDSTLVTIRFFSSEGKKAVSGQCQVQFAVYAGHSLNQNQDALVNSSTHNISAQLNAD